MNWFRKHLKLGSRLALMALVLQFALSFGHYHAFAGNAAPATGTSPTKEAPASSVTQDAATETSRKQQPSNDNREHPAAACAICAVISLAGGALFAAPPVLLLPQPVDLLYLVTDAKFVHLNSVRLAFQSRAPPIS
jgi:hypothetical protein